MSRHPYDILRDLKVAQERVDAQSTRGRRETEENAVSGKPITPADVEQVVMDYVAHY